MSQVFPPEFIDELKSKNDIVSVVSRYLPLEKKVIVFGEDVRFIMKKRLLLRLMTRNSFFIVLVARKAVT